MKKYEQQSCKIKQRDTFKRKSLKKYETTTNNNKDFFKITLFTKKKIFTTTLLLKNEFYQRLTFFEQWIKR